MTSTAVDRFRASLTPDSLAIVDALRVLVAVSHAGLVESIKWNGPSFARGGEHRITLGLERSGGVRVVLHRGARPKEMAGFIFSDPEGLARWPAPDRGVLVLRSAEEVASQRAVLGELFHRWIAATA